MDREEINRRQVEIERKVREIENSLSSLEQNRGNLEGLRTTITNNDYLELIAVQSVSGRYLLPHYQVYGSFQYKDDKIQCMIGELLLDAIEKALPEIKKEIRARWSTIETLEKELEELNTMES